MITDVAFRRQVDSAISDFLTSHDYSPDRLADVLRLNGLGIGKLNEDGELAETEEALEKVLRNYLDSVQEELRSVVPHHYINPESREIVDAITIEDAIEAVEGVWSDGD